MNKQTWITIGIFGIVLIAAGIFLFVNSKKSVVSEVPGTTPEEETQIPEEETQIPEEETQIPEPPPQPTVEYVLNDNGTLCHPDYLEGCANVSCKPYMVCTKNGCVIRADGPKKGECARGGICPNGKSCFETYCVDNDILDAYNEHLHDRGRYSKNGKQSFINRLFT